ncbi:MAG: hypothetical protein AAF217_05060 [Pseudomonadota bacterium]
MKNVKKSTETTDIKRNYSFGSKVVVIAAGAFFTLIPATVFAGEADVVDVSVSGNGDLFSFSVTVAHTDEGWDHYADRWEVYGENGTIYVTRVLAHPHVEEQPFTRSGSGKIPADITHIMVRARDSVHGFGGKEMKIELPGR